MATEWRSFQCSELCDITRGSSPRPIHDWIATEGTPWVKIADATASASRYISRTNECIKHEARTRSVVVHPGDLILSNSATPGIPKFIGVEACIHDGWLLLRNFRGLDKHFAYYVLLHDRPKLVGQGNGSVFTNLKTEILKTHRVMLPPLPEQRAIASVLGALDDKIDLNRRMCQTLEEMARALFKSWFVDFDPVRAKMEGRDPGLPKEIADLFPSRLVDSELGPIPEGWRVATLGEQFSITMGQSPPGSTYNEDGVGEPFFQGRADFGFRFPRNRVYTTAPSRTANMGDTLVSVRAPVGDVNMAASRCCLGRGVAGVRHLSGASSYTYHAMKSLSKRFETFNGEGTVFGSISGRDFNSMPMVSPPSDLPQRFESICGSIDHRIAIADRESITLAALRDTLLPKLISGELRVPASLGSIQEISI